MVTKPDTKNRIAGVADVDGEQGILTANAVRVLENRYLKKDDHGQIVRDAAPALLARRATRRERRDGQAPTLGRAQFFEPDGEPALHAEQPTLMNAGREMGMLSACFVLPVEDSIEGIFDSIKADRADPEGRRRHGLQLLAPASAGRPRAQLGRHDRRPALLHAGASRRRPTRSSRARSAAAPTWASCASTTRTSSSSSRSRTTSARLTNYNISVTVTEPLHGRAAHEARRTRRTRCRTRARSAVDASSTQATTTSGKPTRRVLDRRRDLGHDHRARLAHGRAGRRLHRPHQRDEPDQERRPDRGDEPVRRAAAACRTTRATWARSTSACSCRATATDARFDWDEYKASRSTPRRASSTTSIEVNHYPLPQIDNMCRRPTRTHRPRRDGLRRRALQARHRLQLGRGLRLRRAGHAGPRTTSRTSPASSWPRSAACSRPGRAPTGQALGPPAAQQLHDDRRADRHDLDHRRLLGRHRADVQPGLHPPGHEGQPGQADDDARGQLRLREAPRKQRGFYSRRADRRHRRERARCSTATNVPRRRASASS